MKLPKEYVDDLLVRIAYHSSSIEGNSISLAETVSILHHNTILNKVSLRELFEVDNHRYALEYLLSEAEEKKDVSLDILFKTHALLLDRLHHERGKFKTHANRIAGADYETATVEQTPILMRQWLDNINYRINRTKDKKEILKIVCESHIEFERVHPFLDGNGRVGRMVILFILIKEGIAPLIIENKDKEPYFQFLATQDVSNFTEYAIKRVYDEEKRIKSFRSRESNI